MPEEVQVAAQVLGYTEDIWDKDEEPPSIDKSWDELSPEEQRAAQVIGYDKGKWDDDHGGAAFS